MSDSRFQKLIDYKISFAKAGCRQPDFITIDMLHRLGVTMDDLKDIAVEYNAMGFDSILGMKIVSHNPSIILEEK